MEAHYIRSVPAFPGAINGLFVIYRMIREKKPNYSLVYVRQMAGR